MKKQAENLTVEYDRLLEEHSKLLVTGTLWGHGGTGIQGETRGNTQTRAGRHREKMSSKLLLTNQIYIYYYRKLLKFSLISDKVFNPCSLSAGEQR